MEQQINTLEELKADRVTLNERFKTFTEELNNRKMEIYTLNENLKSVQVKAAVKQEKIEELQTLLKKTEAGASAL